MLSSPAVDEDDIREGRSEQLISPEVVPVVAIRPTSHSTQGSRSNFDAVAITVDEPPAAVALPIGMGQVLPLGGRELDPETIQQIQLILLGTKCCVGCLNMVNLLYLSTGIAFLALNTRARDDVCARTVWAYNAMALCICSVVTVLGLLALREILHVMARIQDPSLPEMGSFYTRLNQVLSVVANYVLFIYGSIVWERLSKNGELCKRSVMTDYSNLYLYFSVTYWMSILFVATQILTVCTKKQRQPPPDESGEVVIGVQAPPGGPNGG